MDELEISGKRYISTRRAAREHGYHSDYMGQLIRGKKVAGQKVGRAWYIEEGSLAVYLGKTPPAAPVAAPAAEAPAPAPVERLVIEEPVPAAAPVVAAPAPEVFEEVARPVAVHAVQPPAQEIAQPPAREIHYAPFVRKEEYETRIPVHTPAPVMQHEGGLRYAADDAPLIPVVTRMPQERMQAPTTYDYAPAPHTQESTFPFVSLSVVALIAVVVTAFASNFVTATMVSQEGKAATVQYAIHW